MLKKMYGQLACAKSNSQQSDSRQSWGFLCGAMALRANAYESEEDVALASSISSPEEECERSLRIGGLTEDAQFIIGLVVDTPAEALQYLYAPLRGQTSRTRLFRYLYKVMGWDKSKIQNTFSELAEYVGDF